jgi:hypothetical protein
MGNPDQSASVPPIVILLCGAMLLAFGLLFDDQAF